MLRGKIQKAEERLMLIQLNEGCSGAFDGLYERYWTDVVDEAYKRLGNIDEAKDIAQEVFTTMWTRNRGTPIDNLPAWLYTVTKNKIYKLMQEKSRFEPVTELVSFLGSYSDRADVFVIEKELLNAYETLLSSLPDQQRIIFKMRYYDEITPDNIASELNISPKTVRNHLGRALLKMKSTFMLFQILLILCDWY